MTIKNIWELNTAINEHAYSYNEAQGRYIFDEEMAKDMEMEYQNHVKSLNSVSAVYSKADTIIVGSSISVSVDTEDKVDTPAYNDGKQIVFNASLLETIDDTTITSLHGFNYHEVAHVLFTPRGGSDLGKWIENNKVRRAFNILEDSRIERLLIAKYPSTRFFLEACVIDYMLKGNPSEWADYFYLTTGRKYLDLDLRQELADRFINRHGLEIALDLARITHEYRALSLPADKEKAKELILAMTKYVGNDDEEQKYKEWSGGHNRREVMDSGRPTSAKEQSQLQNRANQMEKNTSSEKLERGNGTGDTAETEVNESEIKNPDQAEISDEDKRLRDMLNERHDNLIKNESVKGGTAEIRNAIDSNTNQGSTLRKSNFIDMRVSDINLEIADQFSRELERLRIENDPMWVLEQPQGRLNIGRTLHADINDIDRLFDRWDTGNDNRDIEAVILLDNSGSMAYRMGQALEATWIIKRALEAIDARVTVYRFNNDGRLLYSADEKAHSNTYRYLGSNGSTHPYTSLLEAERILSASDRNIKLLFTVSDGGWDYSDKSDEVVNRINQLEGAITTSVYIGDLSYLKRYGQEELDNAIERYRHNSQIFHAVVEPADLVGVASKVVSSAITAKV